MKSSIMKADESKPAAKAPAKISPTESPVEKKPAEERPEIPDEIPILPTRGVALFPGIVATLTVGRPSSRTLLEESLPKSKIIGVLAQKNPEQDDPGMRDLYRLGVACAVLK